MLERLHKILARAGVAALRPAEDMILEGRVAVNGRVVRELGARADADTDVITVDGTTLDIPRPSDPRQYVILHKPVGVISTAHDTHGRPTVVELVPNGSRIFPVGRLDADSEGLLLLTDDGDLAYRLTHPRFEVDKEYRVLVDRTPELPDLRRWRTGVEIDHEMTAPAWVEVLDRTDDGTWLRIVMREGRKRQIREVARVLGMNVRRLIRVREGPLTLADLAPGAWRILTPAEVESLRAHTQHVPSREADEERERKMSEEGSGRRRLRVIRRPARGEATYERPTQESASQVGDESSEIFASGSVTEFDTERTDDNTSPSEAQSPERQRGRFDQGRQGEQGNRDGARGEFRGPNQQERGGRGGDDRSFGGSPRSSQGDRMPYGGRGDRPQRPYGERSDDRRNSPSYGNERTSGDAQDRPAYGNDRNQAPYGGGGSRDRDRSGSMYGGSSSRGRDRSGSMYGGGGSRDRNGPPSGGFRDRNGPPSGGFRDRNGPSGGGFRDRNGPPSGSRDRNGPSGGGFRDRNGPSGGGSRDRDRSGSMYGGSSSRDRNGPSGGGFRDRNGPSGGGFRDRNGPSGGGFRDRTGPSGGGFRDRNGPSGGGSRDRDRSGSMYGGSSSRDRTGPSGGGFRDRNGPSYGNNRDSRPPFRDDRPARPSFDRDQRGPDGNTRGGSEGGPRQGPGGDRGFGRAPRNQGGDQRGGFNARGPRNAGPPRDNAGGFDRRPAGGPPTNNRPPRSGGRDDRGWGGRAPSQDRPQQGGRPGRTGDTRPRDDEE